MRKKLLAAAAVIGGTLVLTGCSTANTAPDQVGLHYKGGAIEATEFSDCFEPSQRVWDGPGDFHYLYPSGQRTYDFKNSGEGADSEAIRVVAAGTGEEGASTQVELGQEGTLSFTLNTDCDNLRAFHEQIGLKYGASQGGVQDWGGLLDVYLGGPLQRALTEATQGVDWKTYYSDATVRSEVEDRTEELLPQYVEELAGAEYFTNFSVQLQRPILPDNLLAAMAATQEAIEQNTAQQQRNVQVQSELDAIRALVEVLGPDGYNTYQAIKDGRIEIIPIPQGSSVVVQPGLESGE